MNRYWVTIKIGISREGRAIRNLFSANSGQIGEIVGTVPSGREVVVCNVSQATHPDESSIIFMNRPLEDMPTGTSVPRGCCILLDSGSDAKVAEMLMEHNAIILVDNPRLAYAKAVNALLGLTYQDPSYVESQGSWIAGSATIGLDVYIEPGCFVGDRAHLGDGAVLMSGARVLRFCSIGNHSIIGPNAVIGADGFGYERDEDGVPVHIPHVGGVEIGNHVYVGASSAIASGTMDPTVVGENVKINNLVHIAHNCSIGAGTMIGAGATLCGSVSVGEYVWIGAGAAVKQSCEIGTSAVIGLGAVVVKGVRNGDVVAGNPSRLTRDLSRINRVLEALSAEETSRGNGS